MRCFAASALALIIGLVATGYLPRLPLIALASLPFSLFAFYGGVKRNTRIGENAQYLGANIIASLLTPLLLSVSLLY
ncbi:MAG TPA: hypothetical protein VFM32_05175 [Spongiibacteraceae bacterium]|nr:hypothetical protein [Spongiibacteraceae bacterium]